MGATREKGLRTERRKSIPEATVDAKTMALETGQEIAWVMRSGAVAVGISAVHRVLGWGKTYCSHAIPPESQRIPAFRSLDPCSTCERLYKRASAAEAAEDCRVGRAS